MFNVIELIIFDQAQADLGDANLSHLRNIVLSIHYHNKYPMLCFPLLSAGKPISTYHIEESVSQKAMVGMFPSAVSFTG